MGAADEPAFFSVVGSDWASSPVQKTFRRALIRAGLTSEQEPAGEILRKSESERLQDESTDWNIQADATLSRMVDFSQFYAVPSSSLPMVWKISEKALGRGIRAGWAWKLLLGRGDLCKLYFGTEDPKEVKAMVEKAQGELKKEFGDLVGAKKSKFSWSWFLEVDDSAVSKWSFDMGCNFSDGAEKGEAMCQVRAWLPASASDK